MNFRWTKDWSSDDVAKTVVDAVVDDVAVGEGGKEILRTRVVYRGDDKVTEDDYDKSADVNTLANDSTSWKLRR